jgi:hypothetical protein
MVKNKTKKYPKKTIKDMEQIRVEYDGISVSPEQEAEFWIRVEMGYD